MTIETETETAQALTTGTRAWPRYPAYHASGVEWLGVIPAHWEVKRLKHVVERFVAGGTPESGNDENWSDDEADVPFVAIGDLTCAPIVSLTGKHVTARGVAEKNLPILPPGTLLYSMYASLGKVAILAIHAVTNQAILGLILSQRRVSRDFLRWWLEHM